MTDLVTVTADSSGLKASIDSLMTTLNAVVGEINTLRDKVDAGSIGVDSAALDALTARVAALEGLQPPAEPGDLSDLTNRVGALESGDAQIQQVLDALSQFVHAGHPGPAYLVDEDGNYLTDDAGNRLTI